MNLEPNKRYYGRCYGCNSFQPLLYQGLTYAKVKGIEKLSLGHYHKFICETCHNVFSAHERELDDLVKIVRRSEIK